MTKDSNESSVPPGSPDSAIQLSLDAQTAAVVAADRRMLKQFTEALARGEKYEDMSPEVRQWWWNRY